MKVLYILHQYFPYFYTGTELLTDNLGRYNRDLGVETAVWAYKPSNDVATDDLERINYRGMPVTFFSHHNGDSQRDRKLYWENGTKNERLEKLILETKPNIVHVTHSSRMGDIIKTINDLKIPYVLTLTDYWLLCPTATLLRKNGELCGGSNFDPKCLHYCFKNNEKLRQERWNAVNDLLNNATTIAYAANFLKKMFQKNGVDTTKWQKIRHGYNTSGERYRVVDRNYRFAFTGTLQPSKGGHLVIKAFRRIKNPAARLVIFGDKKHDPIYSKYCLDLASGDKRVEFRGKYDHTKLVSEFKDIDSIIVPSNWFEPFPFTLINAVTYGFDVIGANIGGIPEIIGINNQDSLFEPGDSDDLMNKMLIKLKNGKNKKAKIFYEQSVESEAFEYFKVYKRALI
ncbi:MAG TPA: glycosyltransferase [Candidatus Saccharimonadales bacterium]|nr:glycosyltransferase [Candidatus Saccharimonadales bacterium]